MSRIAQKLVHYHSEHSLKLIRKSEQYETIRRLNNNIKIGDNLKLYTPARTRLVIIIKSGEKNKKTKTRGKKNTKKLHSVNLYDLVGLRLQSLENVSDLWRS